MELLQNFRKEQRARLALDLIRELFIEPYRALSKWSEITHQTVQVDSGYIAQHLISLLTEIPGTGMRGKGADLKDNSEIKTASKIGGVDVPRWNHNLPDEKSLNSLMNAPHIYYVLFNNITKTSESLRVRVWAITPSIDSAFETVISEWFAQPSRSTNFQLHPPVSKDSNIATNECGNLELPLIFKAEEKEGQLTWDFFEIDYSKKSKLKKRAL